MQATKTRQAAARSGIIYLRIDELGPNPVQPRSSFDAEALGELAESIRSYGILNPLTVRRRGGRYELIAGERRLRAAKLAGLREVPCILLDVSMEDAALLALVENLQRSDLDFVEEANGINQLIRLFGLSQEEAARRLGKSQSAVANKLRLLKLPEDVLETLRDSGLSERHGRALLRLRSDDERRRALDRIIEKDMNVAAAEAYVDALLEKQESVAAPRRSFVMKDVRLFLNSLTRSLELMKQGGVAAGMEKRETDDALILTISIPKTAAAGEREG